mgnify:CR=1 FL=1
MIRDHREQTNLRKIESLEEKLINNSKQKEISNKKNLKLFEINKKIKEYQKFIKKNFEFRYKN